jgi:hypothetical protein
MQVEAARVRERYVGLSTDALRRIVEAPEGQYTPEAQAIAREVLATRRDEPPEARPDAPGARPTKRGEVWAVMVAMAAAGHISKSIFAAVRAAEKHPDVFRQMASDLVRDPWTYALVGVAGVILWRRRSGVAG